MCTRLVFFRFSVLLVLATRYSQDRDVDRRLSIVCHLHQKTELELDSAGLTWSRGDEPRTRLIINDYYYYYYYLPRHEVDDVADNVLMSVKTVSLTHGNRCLWIM